MDLRKFTSLEQTRQYMIIVNCTENHFVKGVSGHVITDSHNISNMRKNYLYQHLNVHGAKNIRHTEIHTAEQLE
jgi:hypothetical protein